MTRLGIAQATNCLRERTAGECRSLTVIVNFEPRRFGALPPENAD
jgi:hypothetical protein